MITAPVAGILWVEKLVKLVSVLHFPEFGGPHNQALRLSPVFAAEGVETLTVLPEGPGAKRLRAGGVAVRTMPLGRVRAVKDVRTQAGTIGRFPLDLVGLARLYRRERPDVVQLNGLINPHAAIVARALGIPVVWQLLDTRPPMRVRRVMMRVVGTLADVVMPVGVGVGRAHPGAEAFGERMVVFYPPVDTSSFTPGLDSTLRTELGIPADAPLVGVVGNVNPQKGHEYFIAAAIQVRQAFPDARFVIAGHIYENHTAYHQALSAQAAQGGLKVGTDLFFLGSRSDVPNILAALDVFALASVPNSEGTPTAILEAMATGVPVVATNVASIPEAVADGETGYVVPSEQPEPMAERIIALLADPELRERMGKRARERVTTEFTLERCVEAHLRAYALAIEHRKGKCGREQSNVTGESLAKAAHALLACPGCRSALAWSDDSATCAACGSTYQIVDGISVMLPAVEDDAHKATQVGYYDEETDPEFEVTRPHGTPAMYRRLLDEKFTRGVDALGSLAGKTVLTVCGGSGMDAEFLARQGAIVIASDISLGAAKRTRERAERFGVQIFPVVADVEHLPFADRSVDLVYVHDGLHHLTDPFIGLREMARVAKRAVSVTEPAQAGLTQIAVKLGMAQEIEDAGNRVERLRPETVANVLAEQGLRPKVAARYAMYYKHRPGPVMRALSLPVVHQLAWLGWRGGNALLGRLGNKMAVQAVRPDADAS